tara:strand:+ start:735 stop:998 length:264 start_codon:yes stop_codon:yes gene_type:complete
MKIKQAMAIAEIIEVRHPLVESRITECGHEHGCDHWFKVTPLDKRGEGEVVERGGVMVGYEGNDSVYYNVDVDGNVAECNYHGEVLF